MIRQSDHTLPLPVLELRCVSSHVGLCRVKTKRRLSPGALFQTLFRIVSSGAVLGVAAEDFIDINQSLGVFLGPTILHFERRMAGSLLSEKKMLISKPMKL